MSHPVLAECGNKSRISRKRWTDNGNCWIAIWRATSRLLLIPPKSRVHLTLNDVGVAYESEPRPLKFIYRIFFFFLLLHCGFVDIFRHSIRPFKLFQTKTARSFDLLLSMRLAEIRVLILDWLNFMTCFSYHTMKYACLWPRCQICQARNMYY